VRFEQLLAAVVAPAVTVAPARPVITPPAAVRPPVATAPPAAGAASAPTAPEAPVVEITELLYRGRAALERADQIQRAIRSAVSAARPMSSIQPLVDELLDLVELAVAD
jgi:hypothetical protein